MKTTRIKNVSDTPVTVMLPSGDDVDLASGEMTGPIMISAGIPMNQINVMAKEIERLREALMKARRAMIIQVTGISDGITIWDIRNWIAEADVALGDQP